MTARQIKAFLVTIGAASALASGCGGDDSVAQPPTTSSPPASTNKADLARTTIYFLADEGAAPIGVRRTIPRRAPYAKEALSALLAGPSTAERQRGLTTAIPATAELRSFSIRNSTLAIVDLSGLPESDDVIDNARIIFQITRTLVGVSGIHEVVIRAQGKQFGLPTVKQGVEAGPWGYGNMPMGPICAGKPGTETVSGDCFSPLP